MAVRDIASILPLSVQELSLEADGKRLLDDVSFTLPKGIYANAASDVPGLGVSNLLFVSRDMKDETVKKILAGIFDNLAEVQKIHPDAKVLSLKSASASTAIPFHPAAHAFYKARGVRK